MKDLALYIKDPRTIGRSLLYNFGAKLPDSLYLRLMFYFQTGKKLHLEHPKTFSEKMQWLKLNNRKPEYSMLVDKYAVKEYVAQKIGNQYIIPTLGIWNSPEEIAWDKLPDQFVLKTTNGGGSKGVIICKDKNSFNRELAIKSLKSATHRDIYRLWREWPYKNVKTRIIAEKYLEEENGATGGLADYKFFCFGGDPKYCQVISDRGRSMAIDFFDENWNHQPFHEPRRYPFADELPKKPVCHDEMRALAAVLSEGFPFIRVDFYELNGTVYFGELTFFPTSGYGGFDPAEWDGTFGKLIDLNI